MYVLKASREVGMAEHRANTKPSNILVITSTHHHLVFPRHVKLEQKIRTAQYS